MASGRVKQWVGLRLPASGSFPPTQSGEGVMSAPLHRRDHRTRPASPAAGRFSVTPSGRARQRADRIIQRPAPRLGSGTRAEGLVRGHDACASVGSGQHCTPAAFLRIRRPTPTQEAVPALAAGRYPDPACHVRGYPAPTDPLANPGRRRGRNPCHPDHVRSGWAPAMHAGALLRTVLTWGISPRHLSI